MSKINIPPIKEGFNLSQINAAFDTVEQHLNEKVLYRNNPAGEPNQMGNDLDMNGKRVYNLPEPTSDNEAATLKTVKDNGVGGQYGKTLRTPENVNELPNAAGRANRLLSFDASGQPQVLFPSNDSATHLRIDLATPAGAGLSGFSQSSTYPDNTVGSKLQQSVSVKDAPWNAKGDAITDDTAAIQAADTYCAQRGLALYLPRGVYRCTDGIDKQAYWIGDGSPRVGVFPLTDDKVFMIPGEKSKLPGTALLFTGSGVKSFTTARVDQFSSMRYCVKNEGRITNSQIATGGKDFSIILDFNFRDTVGGAVTLPNGDASADYDVGLLLVNSEQSPFINVGVGGYYKKSGTVHFGSDPDDTHMYEFRTMGNIGLSIIGDQTGTNSGFNLYGGVINANDHHSRSVDVANERWGECAVFIDIPSNVGGTSRNGINFYGGTVSTKTNTVVKYGACGSINWIGTKFENADQAGSVLAGGPKKQVGTTLTGEIVYQFTRMNSEQIRSTGQLLETAPNSTVLLINTNSGTGYEYWKGTHGVKISGTVNGTTINLTDTPSIGTGGLSIRRLVSDNSFTVLHGTDETLKITPDGVQKLNNSVSTVTVVSESVTVNRRMHRLAGGAVNLSTINGGALGQELILFPATSSDTVTLVTGTGNLRLPSNYTLGSNKTIRLVFNGTFWNELSRSHTT